MTSIYTFEGEEDCYLKIENLDITYRIFSYSNHTLRDRFVQFFKRPLAHRQDRMQDLHLIKGLNLTLRKGERLGLLGVNGSGKTSLCRYIAGMQGRTTRIWSKGRVRAIFDTDSCFLPELTGRENGIIMAKLLFPEVKAKELRDIVNESIAFSEIGDFADTPFKNFSKGMKARLFLSIASSIPSDLLILDEVFDGADIFFNKKINERILNLIRGSGAAIIVTHSLEQLRMTCNRVVVFKDCRLGFDGEVEDGIQYYLDHFSRASPSSFDSNLDS